MVKRTEKYTAHLAFVLTPEDRDRVTKAAESREIPVSNLLRIITREWLDEQTEPVAWQDEKLHLREATGEELADMGIQVHLDGKRLVIPGKNARRRISKSSKGTK